MGYKACLDRMQPNQRRQPVELQEALEATAATVPTGPEEEMEVLLQSLSLKKTWTSCSCSEVLRSRAVKGA